MPVPLGILRQIAYGRGKRLPTRELLEMDSKVECAWKLSQPWVRTSHSPAKSTALVLAASASDDSSRLLPNDLYRFFCGINQQGYFNTICRGCGGYTFSADGRKTHMTTCKELVAEAIRLLRKDHRCVVCDRTTGKQTWGVPLCENSCVVKWRVGIPKSFINARALAIIHNPKLQPDRMRSATR